MKRARLVLQFVVDVFVYYANEYVNRAEAEAQGPMFRMYYNVARHTGAKHGAAMRYASYWVNWRA